MTLLRLDEVSRVVELPTGDSLTILDGIDVEIDRGERVSIVGRSGSGKSTLLNLLGLIDAPTTGTVSIDGMDARRLAARARDRLRGERIGFVFQQFNLLAGRSALENVMTPLLYETGRAFWRRRAVATSMLENVGLGHRLDSTPDRLSGGEQQRVAIARALVRKPQLILADEPTGALDLETGHSVMSLLERVATETDAALVTITHDPSIAARSTRHFRLDSGRLAPAEFVEDAAGSHRIGGAAPGTTR